MKIHQPAELIEDANTALQMLKEGNDRYLKGELVQKSSYSGDREILNNGQKPFAVILTCSDSRAAPEIFFDQKLGDIFVIRNAGNIADTTALGSIEYAVEHLKSRLVVVCGHSKCGAVTAACSGGELPPNINHIVEHIKPAVKKGGDIDEVIHNNVKVMIEQIRADEIVKHLGVTVTGAYYDIHSGAVKWL
ncbi:MAG: carbonic anhydrase [Spirochaetaceae bacterium]|jgi:carbonic anhydrase|nr:carbonic anhydrase [Spirochaetaceae bacterium]